MLRTINPTSHFDERLKHLFESFPSVDKRKMGFTQLWDKEPLWQK
jgi:hypothetical protein